MCDFVDAVVFVEGIAMNSRHMTEVHIFLSVTLSITNLCHFNYQLLLITEYIITL